MSAKELGYFEQAALDSKAFIEHIERYGVIGMVRAVQNYVNQHRDDRLCDNHCRVSSNVSTELSWCIKAIERWYRQAEERQLAE